ncbi:T9SS type A sorting domain-containing protein [Zunongwangia endophytica]|uniref:T9SS type A sorting domain-containing protein n=1 Tax=Zunongwangia endophytica TaxID=1808945 RepID=A0ABV8H512_9FLAO|nr:T9SS type A sorting domain-containing protein [Zunongwangia endophytica]MDN3596198.1 T9SS type A sorting domain-containing protein [Zunongwangia endophytica]
MKQKYLYSLILGLFLLIAAPAAAQESDLRLKKRTEETIDGLSMYPNPVSGDKVYITSTKNLDKEIEIYNVLGKAIKKTKLIGKELDISSLDAGIYIVKIKEKNEIATRKLIIK